MLSRARRFQIVMSRRAVILALGITAAAPAFLSASSSVSSKAVTEAAVKRFVRAKGDWLAATHDVPKIAGSRGEVLEIQCARPAYVNGVLLLPHDPSIVFGPVSVTAVEEDTDCAVWELGPETPTDLPAMD